MLEHSLIERGECPDKQYVNQLLSDVDTRLAIFDYEDVEPDTKLDVKKMNEDLKLIKKDLDILYEIVTELSGKMYRELESYVNGYLLTLEGIADKADTRAREDLEATSLGAKAVYFKDSMPETSFENGNATISLGDIQCSANSKIYGVIRGRGFLQSQVVFLLNGKNIMPYSVNRDMLDLGGKTKKTSYTYSLPQETAYRSTFKIANASIKVTPKHHYEAYGGANCMYKATANSDSLESFTIGMAYDTEETTQYSFYLTNATRIRFDFSQAPERRNFYEDDITGLRRDKMYYYEFTLPKDCSFDIDTNGILYARKEKLSIHDGELYVSEYTMAKDFLINEYEPAEPVTIKDAKVRIHNVDEGTFRIDSIAIKEIVKTEGTEA